jgi:hypothetical protein
VTEGTWVFREEFRSMKFVLSLTYVQMHAYVIWILNVDTRFLPVEMFNQGAAY